jgi:diacylglycerol kinase family enzyme
MGILPLGTLNHFAKDLGIPMELDRAVGVIVAGHERRVDLGEVNGILFLNNSSIGIYPEVVAEREQIREEEGIASKWAAMARAAWNQLRRFPMITVTLRLPDETLRVTSPLVFVGNNRYAMKLFRMGRRAHLDRGELFLYVARHPSRLGFVGLVLRVLFGRLDPEKDFVSVGLPEVEVATTWRRSLRVALDGEVRRMSTPLRYRTRPGALRVLAPPVEA